MPYLFQWLKHAGNVDAQEMYRVFNCGIGMVVIVAREDVDAATEQLRATGETVYNLGTIEARAEGQAQTVVI
jgi:phosphoribosylformylglycinamidine cyclo-ligase